MSRPSSGGLRMLGHMAAVIAAGAVTGLAISRGQLGLALVGAALLIAVIASYVLRPRPPDQPLR